MEDAVRGDNARRKTAKSPDKPVVRPAAVPFAHHGRWGLRLADGRVVLAPTYDSIRPFAGGLARFRQGGRWGFIDGEGRVAVPATYVALKDFRDGVALGKDGKAWYYISAGGDVLGKARVNKRGQALRMRSHKPVGRRRVRVPARLGYAHVEWRTAELGGPAMQGGRGG